MQHILRTNSKLPNHFYPLYIIPYIFYMNIRYTKTFYEFFVKSSGIKNELCRFNHFFASFIQISIRYFFLYLYTLYIFQRFFKLFSNKTVNSIDVRLKTCYNFVRIYQYCPLVRNVNNLFGCGFVAFSGAIISPNTLFILCLHCTCTD